MILNRPGGYRQLALLVGFACVRAVCEAQAPIEQGIPPGIPFEVASVDSEGDGKSTISWRAPRVHHIRIYAGTDPTNVGRAMLVGSGGEHGHVALSDLPPAPRWYFALVPDRGDPLVIAARSLHLTTAANFRDAGGYRTADGEWVRMGVAYRSNGIGHLTDDELDQVDRLNIKVVCDLRTAEEIQRGPDRVPHGAIDVSADVLADDSTLIHEMIAGAGEKKTPNKDLEQRIYRDFVRLPSAQRAYRSLFERLADPAGLPTVFHCTAGKDRTGWAEAVFLTILGVPRSTIIRDYELTNEYLRGDALKIIRQSMGGSAPSKARADRTALDAAFDQVRHDYGSFDKYLSDGLQLRNDVIAAIRQNFLAK